MKRYEDLTHGEVVALTADEVKVLVELEVAHEGLMPAECPEVPTLEDLGIKRDVVAYEVCNLLFGNLEDAETLSKLDILRSDYDHNTGYDYKYLRAEKENGKQIETKQFYRQDDISRVKKALLENEAKSKDYDRKKDEYDKFIKDTAKIRSRVWEYINDAQDLQKDIDLATKTMERYRELASGDEEVAKNFFRNAFKEKPVIIEMVLGEKPAVDDNKKGDE